MIGRRRVLEGAGGAMYNLLAGRGAAFQGMIRRFITGANVMTIAPEIQAGIELEADRPEWLYLKGEALVRGGNAAAAGGAGTNSYVQLQNPANSRMILVVDRIILRNTAAATTTVVVVPGTIATSAGLCGHVGDTRWNPGLGLNTGGLGIGLIRAGGSFVADGVAIAIRPMIVSLLANQNFEVEGPWVIGPGLALMTYNETQNQGYAAYFLWRERPLADGEL